MKSVYNKTISGLNSLTESISLSALTDSSGNDINQIVQQQITNLVSGEFAADELILNSLQANSAFKNIDNTFTANNIFNNIPTLATDLTSSVTNDLQLTNKKYVDNKANSILSANNTFTSNNTFNNIPKLSTAKTIVDYTNDAELTTRKYVNDKIANIYTSNNNFSGSNSYALIPTLTTDLTSSVTNDLQLTNKKYVDNTVYGLYTRDNVFTGDNVFNLDSGHNLTTNKINVTNSFVAGNNSFTYNTIPILQMPYANFTSGNHIVNKTFVDNVIYNLLNGSNTFTETNIFSKLNIQNWAYIEATGALTNTNIDGNTTFIGNLTKTNSFTANNNAFTFNTTPKISSGVTIDVDDANSILPKKEVKYLITTSNNYKAYAGDSTTCYESGGFKYLKAPYINNMNITTAGQSIIKKSVYFNFPSDPNGSDFTGAKIIGTRMTTIKIKYLLCQNDAILTRNGAYVSDGLGKLSRAGTQFDDLDFVPLTVSANNTLGSQPYPTFYYEGSLMVGLMRDSTGAISPYVRPLGQSTPNIVVNTAGKTNAAVTSSFKTVAIQYVLTKYEFYPITFVYDQTKKKLKLNFNLPAILNDPSLNGFISSYDFYVEIDGAYSGYASSTDSLNKTINIPSVVLSDD